MCLNVHQCVSVTPFPDGKYGTGELSPKRALLQPLNASDWEWRKMSLTFATDSITLAH